MADEINATPEQMTVNIRRLTRALVDELECQFTAWEPASYAEFRLFVGEMDDFLALRLRKIFLSTRAQAFESRHVSFYIKFYQVTPSHLEHFFKQAEHAFPTNMTFACGLGASAQVWKDAILQAIQQRRLGFKTTFDLSEAEASEEAVALQAWLSDIVITINLQVLYPANVEKAEMINVRMDESLIFSSWRHRSTDFFPHTELTMIPEGKEDEFSDDEEVKNGFH